MHRLIVLGLLACLSVHTASAQEIPSLAKVFEGKFRFGFGGTNGALLFKRYEA